jgi:hypothetical protein
MRPAERNVALLIRSNSEATPSLVSLESWEQIAIVQGTAAVMKNGIGCDVLM